MIKINNTIGKKLPVAHHLPVRFVLCLILFSAIPAQPRNHMAAGACMTLIRTTGDDRFTIYAPSMNYTGDFRIRDYRFVFSSSLLMPFWSGQDHHHYFNPDYYSSCLGVDLFIGFARDYPVVDRFGISPALGFHLNGIRLRGKSTYLDFYSLTYGLGGTLFTRYRGSRNLLNFGYVSANLDMMDLLYINNRLRRGITFKAGIGHSF
ncbi:hypothetical protein JW948_05755 [bacterium]|nr:hypothetical protein [bacterium]